MSGRKKYLDPYHHSNVIGRDNGMGIDDGLLHSAAISAHQVFNYGHADPTCASHNVHGQQATCQ